METGHIPAFLVGRDAFGDNLIERQRRRIDDAGARRAMIQQRRRNERPGVETDRTARDQVAAPHGDEVRRSRPGTDEMDRHKPASRAPAMAQVAPPSAIRATISTEWGPAPASAAASATEATPNRFVDRVERVRTDSAFSLRTSRDR